MKKITLPNLPVTKFQLKKAKPGKNVLQLYLFFKEDFNIQSLKKKGLNKSRISIIQNTVKKGFFSSDLAELFILPNDTMALLGLGKIKEFHPDRIAGVFRKLPGMISNLKKLHLRIVLDYSLERAIDQFNQHHTQKLQTRTKAKQRFSKKAPFYRMKFYNKTTCKNYSLDDIVSQMASCLEIGAQNKILLKSEAKSSKSPDKTNTSFEFLYNTKKTVKNQVERNGVDLGKMVNRSRYLANLPGNFLNPELYEKYIRKLAIEYGLKINVLKGSQLEKSGFGGILSVGKGSAVSPRIVTLEYKPKNPRNKAPLVLVGKGVTFDTGGISIKPSPEMHEMKFDMCGSALALHGITLARLQKIPLHIICLVGLAENMPDGAAIKPGDVYTAYNGKTIEVQNTDAEGRLVLGDVLSYACKKFDPGIILDFATLTGACVISLGHHAAGVMTSSDKLFDTIQSASNRSLDKIWRLPHWDLYGSELKSSISDLRNIGGKSAGTISAMRFLAEFVEPEIPWAHFDIAGTAWRSSASGSQPAGATGWGLRLLSDFYKEIC